MKKLIAVIAAALIFAVTHEAIARDLTGKEKAVIMMGVKKQLKDPESARFKWVKVHTKDDKETAISICGLVNAKNSMGGYVGDQPFSAIVATVKGKTILIGVTVGDDQAVAVYCNTYGYTDFSEAE